jgi:hypothetical protein
MAVRAKFVVKHVTNYKDGASILLEPVTGGSQENDQFFKYTPGGKVELSTINPEAAKQFVPGQAMYLDFTPAE